MGDRMNNMNKMMQNPKSRNMYLTVIALAVVTLGAGFWFATRTAKNNQAPAGAAVATVPQVISSPGTSTNTEYNEKVRVFNAQQGAIALATTDKSSIPTLTGVGNLSDKSPLDLLEKEAAAKKAAAIAAVTVEPEAVSVPPPEVVVPVVAAAPPPTPIAPPKKYGATEDYMLLSTLYGAWKIKAPSSEFDYARVKEDTSKNSVISQGTPNATASPTTQSELIPLAKAGTIFNAILETGINSDEPSPVLAKIVSGDLKGARLIGQVNRIGEKVLVQFSSISLPTSPTSIKISAVAVDSNTSRTALASNVNNHYLQKYGIMFATAFLGGYANAIARQNTTTIVDALGGATIVQGELKSKDITKQAIGNVGKELAESTRQENQNIKPTVTVDQGIAIGVLLMDDLIVR